MIKCNNEINNEKYDNMKIIIIVIIMKIIIIM